MAVSSDKAWLKNRNKYPTGFCNDINKPAQCEGTKPLSVGGKPLPTCSNWTTCPCECHHRIDQLFEMTGRERVEMPNPDYQPDYGDFKMPSVAVLDPLGIAAVGVDGDMEPLGHSEPVPAPTVAVSEPLATRRTDTGRAARGGLEAQVWDACRVWRTGVLDVICTPKMIGDWIAGKYKIATPSSGAINAVWDRWEKLGFCTQAKKPNRFTGFTGDDSWEHLERLKVTMKRQTRQAVTRTRQGYRDA